MWQLILEIAADILLFFEDFKFWKKKRAQRRFEKKHSLPKRTMVYPFDYYFLICGAVLLLAFSCFFLFVQPHLKNNKQLEKIEEIALLLRSEKSMPVYILKN